MSFFWNLAQQLSEIPPEVYSASVFGLFVLDVTSNFRFPRFQFAGPDKQLKPSRFLTTKGKLPFHFFRMRHWFPYAYVSGLYALRWTTGLNFRTELHVLSVLALDLATALNTFVVHAGKWTRRLGWDGQLLYVQDAIFLDDYLLRLTEVKFGGSIVSLVLLGLHFVAVQNKDALADLATSAAATVGDVARHQRDHVE